MVDVFTQLTQCFDVVSKLECPDPEIWKRYMRRFAKTIVKVLIAYADIVKKEFPEHMKDERIVSITVILKHYKAIVRIMTKFLTPLMFCVLILYTMADPTV